MLERISTVIGLVQRELVVFVFKIVRLICLGSTPPNTFGTNFYCQSLLNDVSLLNAHKKYLTPAGKNYP